MKTLLNYLLNKRWALRFVMLFLNDRKKEQIYIARFRAEMALWGHDISDMTDAEIKEGIYKMGEMVSKCGMTTNEIAQAFKTMANCT